MKKRWISALLAMVLTISILTGCGVDQTVPSVNSDSQQVTDPIGGDTPSQSIEPESDGLADDSNTSESPIAAKPDEITSSTTFSVVGVPTYSGSAYVAINGNIPYFTAEDLTTSSFEFYSPLDDLGRCGIAYACIGQDIMPTEDRGSIGQVKPTGWHTVKYDCVDGKYLYSPHCTPPDSGPSAPDNR